MATVKIVLRSILKDHDGEPDIFNFAIHTAHHIEIPSRAVISVLTGFSI